MSTTQAFRNALHIPFTDPEVGMVVTTLNAGDKYLTKWETGASGTAFPSPTKPDQMLASGAAPDYHWTLIDGIDCGEFA